MCSQLRYIMYLRDGKNRVVAAYRCLHLLAKVRDFLNLYNKTLLNCILTLVLAMT